MKNFLFLFIVIVIAFLFTSFKKNPPQAWIRINLMGYKPSSSKVAV